MNTQRPKPTDARDILATLEMAQANLGKGGRRLAEFILANPGASALMTAAEMAQRCGVHASSVVRLVQGLGFSGYREFQGMLQDRLAIASDQVSLREAVAAKTRPLRIHLLADSGRSFNEGAVAAAQGFCQHNPAISIACETHVSYTVNAEDFARRIEAASEGSDGLILVAREHPAVNDAVRGAIGRGVAVVCLTTDLPSSGRTAYVGSDQYASGATAGWMCGRFLPQGGEGRVLFICSVPFRCQQDREQGFRQVLRSEFPHLSIDEKVSSDESVDVIYDAVRRSIAKNGAPAAIYNVSGANLGVGRALEDEGLSRNTIFIGHELNVNSRGLLERGIMDLTISHDFEKEIALAVDCVKMARQGIQPANRMTQSLLFTRFNCAIF
ncbi:MAG: substrate-binding domain-containing protein [Paracoccaceae bacterium]|nr:substrate-binding domain-containing protein [Paracoccaceae bacterium]